MGGIPSLGGPPDLISFKLIVFLSKSVLGNSFAAFFKLNE